MTMIIDRPGEYNLVTNDFSFVFCLSTSGRSVSFDFRLSHHCVGVEHCYKVSCRSRLFLVRVTGLGLFISTGPEANINKNMLISINRADFISQLANQPSNNFRSASHRTVRTRIQRIHSCHAQNLTLIIHARPNHHSSRRVELRKPRPGG